MSDPILPTTWGQLAFLLASCLLIELRHYVPLVRRYFAARLRIVEAQADATERDDEENHGA
jgi:hypothetical protein